MDQLLEMTWPWLKSLGVLVGAALVGVIVYWLVKLSVRLTLARHRPAFAESLRDRLGPVVRLLLPLVALHFAVPAAIAEDYVVPVQQLTTILLTLAGAWFLVRLMLVAEDVILSRLGLEQADNLAARRVQTQFRILRRLAVSVIVFLAIVAVLMSFDAFRRLGTGLLASAGIAGIVLGLAAQRTLGNLFAGFQIAITQPIRLDDVVVVEGEWGRIEQITLTYVVVRIWDLRRLVLPISYFLEHPFTNWTRTSADILGTVYLHTDYTVPVQAVREELQRIVEQSAHWDGKVCGLVVTDAKEHTLELRALVSARDGGEAWNLRCEVREKLVDFLQRDYPDTLPRIRAEIGGGTGEGSIPLDK